MIRALLSLVFAFALTACTPPGITYSVPVTVAVSGGDRGTIERPKSVPVLKIGSDFAGDHKVRISANGTTIEHELTTPRDAAGNIAMELIPVLSKDRTTVIGYRTRPVVASVDTSATINAWGNFGRKLFSGFNNMLGTIGASLVGLEAAKQAGSATTAAVEAVRP